MFIFGLRSVYSPRYMPCEAVHYPNQVKFYSTAINVAPQPIPPHVAAAGACGNPTLTYNDLRWIAANCGGIRTVDEDFQ